MKALVITVLLALCSLPYIGVQAASLEVKPATTAQVTQFENDPPLQPDPAQAAEEKDEKAEDKDKKKKTAAKQTR